MPSKWQGHQKAGCQQGSEEKGTSVLLLEKKYLLREEMLCTMLGKQCQKGLQGHAQEQRLAPCRALVLAHRSHGLDGSPAPVRFIQFHTNPQGLECIPL